MYRGFNLIDFPFLEPYYENGKAYYEKMKTEVNAVLDEFVTPNGVIDGSKLQENWFPQIECDIFLSHSHKDEKTAIALAGVLNKMGLSCFIDSCIWGYSDDLLKIIDNKHCFNTESKTYDYSLRNYTTSHVHMMLSNALFKMIDSSECIFFLNSPNSVKLNDVITKTVSPWIYSEISATQVVRKKKPNRVIIKSETRTYSEQQRNINESISVEYDINLSHLNKLENGDFVRWIDAMNDKQHKLDTLYSIFPLTPNKPFFS